MQTEVANILHNKLLDLVDGNVITHHCGLVRKVDTKLLSGGQKFDQVPVPYQTTEADCCADGWSYLVPDATKRCIVYFEDFGVNFDDDERRLWFSSNLRLICWYNAQLFEPDENLQLNLMLSLLTALKEPIKPEHANPMILGLKVQALRSGVGGWELFNRYSYEKGFPMLYEPYGYFGIDLKCSYQINYGCRTQPVPTEPDGCC